MEESEKLRHLSRTTDNDFKAWTYHFKSNRAERQEYFDSVLPEIQKLTEVEVRENGSYTFNLKDCGKCDLYPKKNTVLIRKKNKWIRGTRMEFIFSRIGLAIDKNTLK